MKRTLTAALSGLVLAMALSAFATVGAQSASQEQNVQIVKLSFDDKGYVMTPSKVTKDIPVRMDVDLGTVKGCMRTVVIGAFNVKQTVKEGATTIEFTPTKTGEIEIVCGMRMGKGAFTVVDPAKLE